VTKILLVDDEQTLLQALSYNLKKEGYDVLTATDGVQALSTARAERPDVIVLDVMLPGLGGMEVCRILRGETTAPILMLTARSDELDRVLGLELGADEYIVKPVGLRELLARIKAMLRRVQMHQHEPAPAASSADAGAENVVQTGPLCIDVSQHEVRWHGAELSLRPKEFDLLLYLARNKGRVLTRDSVLAAVWGYDYIGDPRTVDVHIRWLREKIEAEPSRPKHIQTIRGAGYKLSV
jgi:DNA-binding response OmpR family regulator